jgi:hypothetical protein
MNEKDFRDVAAMLFGLGMVIAYKDNHPEDVLAERCYKLADALLEARDKKPETEVGIVAAKTRRKK